MKNSDPAEDLLNLRSGVISAGILKILIIYGAHRKNRNGKGVDSGVV